MPTLQADARKVRREVLDRLLLPNHERHAEEVEESLHDRKVKKGKGKKRGRKESDDSTPLVGFEG